MSKKQVVQLKRLANGRVHEFEFDHALSLLRLQEKSPRAKKGWEIAEKEWIFKDNEISRKPNTGSSKKSKKDK